MACPIMMYKCLQNNAATFRRVWPLIVNLCEGSSIDNRIVGALFYLERELVDAQGESVSIIDNPKLRAKLLEAGLSAVQRAINEGAAFFEQAGAGAWARGVLKLLNYKRQQRLGIRGDKKE